MAASPEPVLDFAAKMSNDDVESTRGVAAEPVLQLVLKPVLEETEFNSKLFQEKKHEYEWNKVSYLLKRGQSESDCSAPRLHCARKLCLQGIFHQFGFFIIWKEYWYRNKILVLTQ